MNTLIDLACYLDSYKLAFHCVYKLVNTVIVLPHTSATCERTFSALILTKSCLRSTMCDGRLSNMAVLSGESRRVELLKLDKFVVEFNARHGNRELLLHLLCLCLCVDKCPLQIKQNMMCSAASAVHCSVDNLSFLTENE